MTRTPDFNRLAAIYRWMEWLSFGPWLGWCRSAYLPELSACRHAVVLGDGDGRFTARLLAANPTIRIDAVDASSAMLSALVRRAGPDSSRVRTYLADAREWQPGPPTENPLRENETYDLIATHFFLDCLTTAEVQHLAANLRPFASRSAVWLVSDFAIPSTMFGRAVARPGVSALYAAFALFTGLTVRSLPDHSTALFRSGFNLKKRRTWLAGLLISELWSANASDIAPTSAPKPL
jgi:SAM-dependent methyltransferase